MTSWNDMAPDTMTYKNDIICPSDWPKSGACHRI